MKTDYLLDYLNQKEVFPGFANGKRQLGGIIFKKNEPNVTYQITLNLDSNMLGIYTQHKIRISLVFNEVEDLMKKYFKKNKLVSLFRTASFSATIENNVRLVNTDEDLETYASVLNSAYNNQILGLMDKYSTLEKVYQIYQQTKGKKRVPVNIYPNEPARLMIMMKKLQDKEYDNYSKMILDYYKPLADKEKREGPDTKLYNAIKLLHSDLESM